MVSPVTLSCHCPHGVATDSRIDNILGLFGRILSVLQGSFVKHTCNLIDPTNRSHTMVMVSAVTVSSEWTSHYISNWLKSKLPLSHRVPSYADCMRFENRSSKHWTTVCAQLSRFRTSSLVVSMTCGAVWCSVLQCGAMWCSVLQCVAVWLAIPLPKLLT